MNKSFRSQENNICIVTGPLEEIKVSYSTISQNLLSITEKIVDDIYLITPNASNKISFDTKIKLIDIKSDFKVKNNLISKILYRIIIEMMISVSLLKTRNKLNGPVLILSGALLLPTITAKLIGKKAILIAVASESNNAKLIYPGLPILKVNLHQHLIKISEKICFFISDRIMVESPNVSKFLGIDKKYADKIVGNGHLFIPDSKFKILICFNDRTPLIGYIGRMSGEKGVLNFVEALPAILNERKNLQVFIGGDGLLKRNIEEYLLKEKLTSRVNLHGWISHDDLPQYLNQIQLLILPSCTEGLPNIVLEAMACGTPVLATPVGAIPDIIKDCETGFIMENNSPVCIAENIIRVLENPNLEKISLNAKKMVEEKFSFERTIKYWKRFLDEIYE